MDRDEAIKLLNSGPDGVPTWNQWRTENKAVPDLSGANLRRANLIGADLREAVCENTTFGEVDLSAVKGLELIRHKAPSTVGIDTLFLSRGKLPDVFLRGIRVHDKLMLVLTEHSIASEWDVLEGDFVRHGDSSYFPHGSRSATAILPIPARREPPSTSSTEADSPRIVGAG